MKPSALRVLRALEERARTKLDIYRETGIDAVAQRIQELRDAGCVIDTDLVWRKNRHGEQVRVALYRLIAVPRNIARATRVNAKVKKAA